MLMSCKNLSKCEKCCKFPIIFLSVYLSRKAFEY